ncbi:MAG: hypothetical protein M3N31_08625 [Actinomycetota bacterium]|nr:hypothetical protein [Actinomycetota bacterium]
MKRLIAIAGLSSVAVLGPLSDAAGARDPGPPHGGPGSHPHHVHTGNGCRNIDAVLFEPSHRGLHQGSNASGPQRGPWHSTCEEPHPHVPPSG